MSDISAPARTAYETGTSPVAYAIAEITAVINAHRVVARRAATEPGPHPDVSPQAMACRIVGVILNAGFEMPVWPIPEPGQEAE